jgi:phytoene dehydrogenase-like protein
MRTVLRHPGTSAPNRRCSQRRRYQRLVRPRRAPELFRDFVEGSIWDLLGNRFESEAVQGFLGLTATFGTNAGPRTPGTAYVMAHHLFGATTGKRGQTGYVRGGMSRLADALSDAAQANGAVLRTDADVARIIVRDGNAVGVELIDGAIIHARIVISNADPKRTFLGLIGRTNLADDFAATIEGIQTCGQALKVNCALDRLPSFTAPPLA